MYNEEPNPRNLIQFFSYFEPLFKGLVYMKHNKYAHMDIKGDNIMIDDKNRVRYIDFGLSDKYKNIPSKDYLLASGYYVLPMETYLTHSDDNYFMIGNRAISREKRNKFVEQLQKHMFELYEKGYMKRLNDLYFSNNNSKKMNVYTYITEPENFENYMNDIETMTFEEFYTKIYEKVDVFSLGMVLVDMWIGFMDAKLYMGDDEKIKKEEEEQLKKLYNLTNDEMITLMNIKFLITQMIQPYYKNRLSPEQAYYIYIQIYPENNTMYNETTNEIYIPSAKSIEENTSTIPLPEGAKPKYTRKRRSSPRMESMPILLSKTSHDSYEKYFDF